MEINAMKIRVREGLIEIEKEFNHIKSDINGYILQEDSQIPPDALFQRLDDEFKKINEKYKERNDQINLLHVEHNYLWSKSFQYLPKDPTKSLNLIIKAISKLLDRHELRPYPANTFENMLGTYEVVLIKISEKGELINFDDIEEEFINFIKTYISSISISSEKFESIINILVQLFIKNQYDKKINDLKIRYSNFDEYESLANEIKTTLNILEKHLLRNPICLLYVMKPYINLERNSYTF
jgi:hypothetical protein